MADVDPSMFLYQKRPTVSSLLWAAWLHAPCWLRLALYRALLRRGERTGSPRTFRLPFGLYAKYGHGTTVSEALATQHVATNTSIPVPTILDVLTDEKLGTVFLMTQVPGRPLANMDDTLNTMSAEQVSAFTRTMRDWFMQLRTLTPPGGGSVSGFLGTQFSSYRIDMNRRVGPFASVDTFHAQLFCTLPSTSDPAARALAGRVRAKRHRICFTHGDISPNNILVDDNYRPTGLVDWGCAAWMPEYWELTTALWRRQRYAGWVKIFSNALPQYEDELAVEMELWKTICPF